MTATLAPPVTVPGALPLIGHGTQLMRDPLGFFERIRDLGPVVRVRIGPRTGYVINQPDLARHVLVSDRKSYDKGGPVIEAVRMVTGNGLGACNAVEHDRQRPMMQPSFHHSRFPGYVEVMKDCTEEFSDTWQHGQQVAVTDEAYRLFSSITTRTLVSTAEGAEAATVMGQTMPTILQGAYRRAIIPLDFVHQLPTPTNLAYNRAQNKLAAAIDKIIKRYRDEDFDHGDVLSLIMAARSDTTGLALTDDEVRDQIRTVLAGSIETEASLLSWVFQLLALHPEAERTLWAELESVLADRAAPDFEDLNRLTYAKQVVTEAHRLYPPIWLITRVALVDTELGGHRIPKGADVLFSPHALHRIPAIFPEPGKFIPERWASGAVTSEQREAFLGFGAGHTKCLGDVFGPTAVTVALATLARRWKLRHVSDAPLALVAKVTLYPAALTMRVETR